MPGQLRCFRRTFFYIEMARLSWKKSPIGIITDNYRVYLKSESAWNGTQRKQLDFFCGLDEPQPVFPHTVSPFPSFVKWGHEMLHNTEKVHAGGSHKKTNCFCLHSLIQSKTKGLHVKGPLPEVCARVSACWCWGSAAHGAGSTRCHIIAADGRGGPGIKEPCQRPYYDNQDMDTVYRPTLALEQGVYAGLCIHHPCRCSLKRSELTDKSTDIYILSDKYRILQK